MSKTLKEHKPKPPTPRARRLPRIPSRLVDPESGHKRPARLGALVAVLSALVLAPTATFASPPAASGSTATPKARTTTKFYNFDDVVIGGELLAPAGTVLATPVPKQRLSRAQDDRRASLISAVEQLLDVVDRPETQRVDRGRLARIALRLLADWPDATTATTDPLDARRDLLYAQLQLRLGERATSRTTLQRVAAGPTGQDQQAAALQLADLEFDAARLSAATAAYQQAVAGPDTALSRYARYKLAWCHYNAGHIQSATTELLSLLRELDDANASESPLATESRRDLGTFAAKLPTVAEALTVVARSCKTAACRHAARSRLAAIYELMGQPEHAGAVRTGERRK